MCITETQQKNRKVRFSSNIKYTDKMRETEDQKGGRLMILWRENEDIIIEKAETKSKDILLVESKINQMEMSIVLIYMSVNDSERNEKIRKEIENIIRRAQQNEKEIIILEILIVI